MLLIKKAEQSGDIGVFTNQKFASKLSVVIFNRQKGIFFGGSDVVFLDSKVGKTPPKKYTEHFDKRKS